MSKNINLSDFSNFLQSRASEIDSHISRTIALCCEKVRSDIQYEMAHTEINTEKSYYSNNKTTPHHPSLPGNPPAVDSGNLRESIRYEIHNEGKTVYGIVGDTLQEDKYGEDLEYGTSDGKLAPRPWLRPAMLKNNDFIRSHIAKAVADTFKGGNE